MILDMSARLSQAGMLFEQANFVGRLICYIYSTQTCTRAHMVIFGQRHPQHIQWTCHGVDHLPALSFVNIFALLSRTVQGRAILKLKET